MSTYNVLRKYSYIPKTSTYLAISYCNHIYVLRNEFFLVKWSKHQHLEIYNGFLIRSRDKSRRKSISVLYDRNWVDTQFRKKILHCPKYFRMYPSIEGRSIEIDKKIDIFDITSKIAAVSAALMYIEFNAGSRHHTR